jgi:hypothetical protein
MVFVKKLKGINPILKIFFKSRRSSCKAARREGIGPQVVANKYADYCT